MKRGANAGSALVSIPWGVSAPVDVPIARSVRRFLAASRRPVVLVAVVEARDSGAGPNAAVARARGDVRLGGR